jgi:pSer/pThr/pTyr-binding forkhead associated (FHA) protein
LPPNKDNANIKSNINYDKYLGRYFQIYYNFSLNGYFLRDLGNGLGTFIKIKDSMLLKDNSLINIGDCYIVINFDPPDIRTNPATQMEDNFGTVESHLQGINKTLILKVHNEKNDNKTKMYSFEPSKGTVRIGRRKHGNDIEIDDPLASKTNCNIQYKSKEGWVIRDGNELMSSTGNKQTTHSTNGTWILAIEDFRIYDGMIFKGHFNLFTCNLKEIVKEE